MNNHIEISEKDIYLFVFSPKKLAQDKLEYLTANEIRFQNEISLCKELKESKDIGTEALVEKILEKINIPQFTELYPQTFFPVQESGVKLAAASVLIEKPRNSISYVDDESRYLVRIVKSEAHKLLYLFSSDKSKKNFTIQIMPSESKYTISDLNSPIEISDDEVEKIIIT